MTHTSRAARPLEARIARVRVTWMRRYRRAIAALVLALISTLAPPATAHATTPDAPNAAVLAVLEANPAALRATGDVPSRWPLLLDSAGNAQLVLFMYYGDVILNGEIHPYQWVSLSAFLDSSKLPTGIDSTSKVDTMPSDLYLIDFSTTSADLTSKFRSLGLDASVAKYVPGGLQFTMGSDLVPMFRFNTTSPYSSPFNFAATLTPTFVPTFPDTVDYWHDTPSGTVKIETNDNNEAVGGFLNWTFQTASGTPIAQMIGGTTQSRTCSANILDPILGIVAGQVRPGCISRETFSSTSMSASLIPR